MPLFNPSDISINGKVFRPSTTQWETAVINREYLSPEQHGGIYGIIYRTYINTTLPSYLAAEGATSKLINYSMRMSWGGTDEHVVNGWATDSTNFALLQRTIATGALILSANGFTVMSGWVDYTKS